MVDKQTCFIAHVDFCKVCNLTRSFQGATDKLEKCYCCVIIHLLQVNCSLLELLHYSKH